MNGGAYTMKAISYEQFREMKARDDVGAKWFMMGFKEQYPELNSYYESLNQKQESGGKDNVTVGT